jgi:large subunit ribosomal protein L25
MTATLKGNLRDKLGSRWARRLRMQGRLPACVQGEGKGNLNIEIDEDTFLTARRDHEHLFDIELGKDTEPALIRELGYNLMGDRIIHIEFRRVVLGRKTEVEVELQFVGHPKGGVLNHLVTHLTVNALPAHIPDSIEVRVDELELGHPLLAKDVTLPEGVDLLTDLETQVAVVNIVRSVEEETAAEGEAVEGEVPAEGADPAEPKPEGDSA